jgi:N-terminal half of MaoC dehydratase
MYVDRDKALKAKIPPMEVEVERGRLRFFAKAIGETNPVYFDLEAARQAGHRDLPVPLTFLGNSLELELPEPMGWLAALGVNLSRALHGEQSFVYRKLAYAGDQLIFERRIVDVYTKKGGALEFVVKRTDVKRAGEIIAEVDFVVAIRHPEAAS